MSPKKSTARVTPRDKSPLPPDTLIVGDWFVDEHWSVGVHRSSSSSRTGRGHYRALQPLWGEVRAFCGAGRSAFFLRNVRGEDGAPFFGTLFGLGFWNGKDTDALRTLFDPQVRQHSPYRLSDDPPHPPTSIELVNMHDGLHTGKDDEYREAFEFTNRIIRIYRQEKEGTVSFERFDFEPRLRPVRWTKKQLDQLEKSLKRHLGKKRISVVVIKDLLKGAVTKQIIERLANGVGKHARWYVSSKKWLPDWLKLLAKVDLRLLCVPQVAAREATHSERDLTRWLTRSGHPTLEALAKIDSLQQAVQRDNSPNPLIVVMPRGFSALCRAPDPAGDLCLVQPQEAFEPTVVPMGGASIFFPALCACLEFAEQKGRKADTQEFLLHAIECTADWVRAEGDRVLNPDTWKPDPAKWSPAPSLLKLSTCLTKARRVQGEPPTTWEDESSGWQQALDADGLGVVNANGRKELQIWRSMVEVDGYVCCESKKRQKLRSLVRGIDEFCADPRFHVACMLVAAPGGGKTFLVNRLADAANLEPVPFNISHLNARGEILGWFDQILAKQEESTRRLLVFVDEINSPLDGSSPPYSAFLSPLEDAAYVRDGQTLPLQPCVWIFAGTESPKHQPKGSDFLSRATLGLIDLNPDSRTELELDRVYAGASLLRSIYPDVRRVSAQVLKAFRGLPKDVRIRDLKHFVRDFSHIQYARVTSANVPTRWPCDEGEAAQTRWRRDLGSSEDADIEIVL